MGCRGMSSDYELLERITAALSASTSGSSSGSEDGAALDRELAAKLRRVAAVLDRRATAAGLGTLLVPGSNSGADTPGAGGGGMSQLQPSNDGAVAAAAHCGVKLKHSGRGKRRKDKGACLGTEHRIVRLCHRERVKRETLHTTGIGVSMLPSPACPLLALHSSRPGARPGAAFACKCADLHDPSCGLYAHRTPWPSPTFLAHVPS